MRGTVTVPLITLDRYVQDRGISRVDAVKIDVEGAAWSVLKGASFILSHLQPGLIVVEIERDDDTKSIKRYLQEYGYEIITLPGHRWTIIEARRPR